MDGKTITLKVYETLTEAEFVKDALEQNGVPCFLSNEHVAQLYPIFNSALGGIHLHIFEEDQAKALDILANLQA